MESNWTMELNGLFNVHWTMYIMIAYVLCVFATRTSVYIT